MKITRTVTTGTHTVSVAVEGPTAGDCIVALQEIWTGVEPPTLADPAAYRPPTFAPLTGQQITTLSETAETQSKAIERLTAALRHYADHDNWAHSRSQYAAHDRLDGNNDGWLIAEKALNPDG